CLGSRSGELWIGTMGGVSIYKGKKDEKYLFTNFTTQNGLPNNVVLNLAVSPSIVYAGSPTGLMIFENEKWRAIGISEGLASDWVSALALDGENLWIGTKKGLQFLSNGKISTSMNFKNGFPSSHIQALAVRNNSDGSASIFVGTDEGLIVLNRERK
ncbi:hypothetical protein HYY75_06645, partial [bacterium]|nr:hypothetical protein [bacterium]